MASGNCQASNPTIKKRGQSIMDEISENLKRTIKKYNEIDMENDLSVVQSCENEETKSNALYNSHSNCNANENNKIGSTTNPTKKAIDNTDFNTQKGNNYMREAGLNSNLISNNSQPNAQMPSQRFTPSQQFGKIMRSLDDLEEVMNKDFEEVEGMIENVIEKELKNFFK